MYTFVEINPPPSPRLRAIHPFRRLTRRTKGFEREVARKNSTSVHVLRPLCTLQCAFHQQPPKRNNIGMKLWGQLEGRTARKPQHMQAVHLRGLPDDSPNCSRVRWAKNLAGPKYSTVLRYTCDVCYGGSITLEILRFFSLRRSAIALRKQMYS